jgi:hypothetical protein
LRTLAAFVLALACTACGARSAPPSADAGQRPFPDVGGRTILLLPVQAVVPSIGLPEGSDAAALTPLSAAMAAALEGELSFWLTEGAPRTRWILPDVVVRAAERSRTLDVHPRNLTVRDFLRARLQSIGDPLYGELRSIGMLADARLVLLPVGAVWVPEIGGDGRVHLALALIDTMGGAVLWYGVVAGSPGPADDPAVAASTARALLGMVVR